MADRYFISCVISCVAFAVMLLILPGLDARAGDMHQVRANVSTTAPQILDGKTFLGGMGPLGKPKIASDSWVFANGTFMSKQCEKCGFPRGQYRVKKKHDGVHFIAETPCPRTDARITWRGKVDKEGRIEGVYTWRHTRWYRTIEKQFWFKGTLSASAKASTR